MIGSYKLEYIEIYTRGVMHHIHNVKDEISNYAHLYIINKQLYIFY